MAQVDTKSQVVVIGGGPGGYAAAFMAADKGLEVTLIDKETNPGGVCLYRGCIPSKALLHAAKVLDEAREAIDIGIDFGDPKIDINKMRAWKEDVVKKLTGGLGVLCKQRKVQFIQGTAKFLDANSVEVEKAGGEKTTLAFESAILASGSRPAAIPGLPKDSKRVWDSTSALELKEVPDNLLVIGGGYIGLELGSVYAELGSKVSVVEMDSGLLPGADRDLVSVLSKKLKRKFENVMLNTKTTSVKESGNKVKVGFEGKDAKTTEQEFDAVLVSVGRRPNSENLGLENTKVKVNERGFVEVDEQRRTAEPTIFAIGDVAGDPMLAHKATAEGKIAAEAIAGHRVAFEPKAIPAVVFTDPELAWAGLTESEAKALNKNVSVAKFPWAASGRALTMGGVDGLTKLIIDPDTEYVLGVGIVGPGAGEMIAEGVLAIEMAALASDVKLSIHPHPTLSESVMEAAEVFYGEATSIYRPKR